MGIISFFNARGFLLALTKSSFESKKVFNTLDISWKYPGSITNYIVFNIMLEIESRLNQHGCFYFLLRFQSLSSTGSNFMILILMLTIMIMMSINIFKHKRKKNIKC